MRARQAHLSFFARSHLAHHVRPRSAAWRAAASDPPGTAARIRSLERPFARGRELAQAGRIRSTARLAGSAGLKYLLKNEPQPRRSIMRALHGRGDARDTERSDAV